jgi:hypothetical protein
MADIISRLKLESGEFDSKIKRAGQELLAYSEHCKKVGLQMGYANKDAVAFAKQLGSMSTTSQTARGKINELSEAFVNAKVMFKNMTDAEKNSEFGRNLSASLDQLKSRLQSAKKDLADVQQELSGSKFGQFGSILDGIGQKMGLNANITELLTSKTALMSAGIGAAGAIVAKATQEWAAYNAELAKQDQITTVTTGLKGSSADAMTDQARALSDTYGVDFREAINAANTLMTQFGQTGEQAMSLIRDGMQGMIQGDGPKLLSMIQQYSPAFRDAGVSASQLVAVIQNSEGGIFTDQNMNAIVMGIKNIRLMTKATSDALAQLGIDGQKMSQQLRDGSLTIFDALKQVATQIQGVNSNSQAAGEVMQQVFGRQGAMAGTKLGEAIATLNTNLQETKRQTGEVGDAYNDLYNANVKLNGAIRDCFEYDGWEQMATGIKSSLVSALASVIEKLATIKQFLTGMSANDYLKQMGGDERVNRMVGRLGSGQGNARSIYDRQVGAFESYINPRKKYLEYLDAWRRGDRSEGVKAEVDWGRDKFGIDDRAIRNSVKAAESQLEEYQKKAEQVFSNVNKKSGEINIDLTGGNKGGNKGGKTTTIKEDKDDFEEIVGLIPNAEEAVKSLQQQIRESWDEGEIASLTKDLEKAEAELQRLKAIGKEAKPKEMVQGLSGFNAQTMSAWMSGRQSDLSKAEYDSADYSGIMANIADMNTIKTVLEQSMKAGIDAAQFDLEPLWEKVFDGENIPDGTWQSMIDVINEKLKEMDLDPIQLDFQTGDVKSQAKEMAKDWQAAGSAIQAVGSAMSQIEDPAAKVVGTVAQAVATIALGYAQATTSAAKLGPWAWIAFAATGLATMISTISAIHSSTGYANGGMIKGNSYSGDNIGGMVDGGAGGFVGLNAGEVVLNAAQQRGVASALSEGGNRRIEVFGRLSGETIYLSSDRYTRRTGRGTIMTWK